MLPALSKGLFPLPDSFTWRLQGSATDFQNNKHGLYHWAFT